MTIPQGMFSATFMVTAGATIGQGTVSADAMVGALEQAQIHGCHSSSSVARPRVVRSPTQKRRPSGGLSSSKLPGSRR